MTTPIPITRSEWMGEFATDKDIDSDIAHWQYRHDCAVAHDDPVLIELAHRKLQALRFMKAERGQQEDS